MSFGRTSCGWRANEFYFPILTEVADDIHRARQANRNPALDIPLPASWAFGGQKSQLLPEPSESDFPRFKALYGFVGKINDAACNDTATPLCLQIITKLSFYYGASREEYKRSWAYARVNAFSPKCISR